MTLRLHSDLVSGDTMTIFVDSKTEAQERYATCQCLDSSVQRREDFKSSFSDSKSMPCSTTFYDLRKLREERWTASGGALIIVLDESSSSSVACDSNYS